MTIRRPAAAHRRFGACVRGTAARALGTSAHGLGTSAHGLGTSAHGLGTAARAVRATALAAGVAVLAFGALAAPAGAAPSPSPSPASTVPPASGTALSWGVAPASNSLGAARAHFEYTLDPGVRITDALVITNHSDRALTLRVYASDALTTQNGGIDLLAAGQQPTDVGAWITMAAGTVTVPAGRAVAVPFTVAVPANATPGDHSGGVVTSLVDDSAGGVRVDHRLGSRVYIRVPGALAPALSVTGIRTVHSGTWNPFGTGQTRITYTVSNTGNVRLAAHQRVTVAGPFGMLAAGGAIADLPEILPGNSLTRTVTVTGVWPALRMTASIDLVPFTESGSASGRSHASAALWVAPWGQLLLLVVLAAAGYGLVLVRRWQKRRVAAVVAAAVADALSRSAH